MDYFSGSEVALHNIRSQIQGSESPYEPTQDEVASLLSTSTRGSGSNAFNLILRRPWSTVLDLHMQLRLTTLVAIYEGWVHATIEELALSKRKGAKLDAFLQGKDATVELPAILGNPHPAMTAIASACSTNRLNRKAHVVELTCCYRAFKEVRNSLAHTEKRATARAVTAYHEYMLAQKKWTGITSRAPELPLVSECVPVKLTAQGLAGFASVLLVMIATFDAIISESTSALLSVKAQWRATHGNCVVLPARPDRARAKFLTQWRNAHLPILDQPDDIWDEFRRSGLVFGNIK